MRIVCFGTFSDYTIQLANALSEKNEDVLFVTLKHALMHEYETNIIDERVKLHLLTKKNPLYHPYNLWIFINLIRSISKFNPEIVHLQIGLGFAELPVFLFSKFLKRYNIVVTFHDVVLHLGEKSWLQEFLRHFIRKYADQIIVHGEKLKEKMIKEYNIPHSKVNAILPGECCVAPFKKYEREDIKENGNFILFFGRIWEYKGLEYLIKAEPIITKEVPEVKIVIAGMGESFTKYEQMIGNRRAKFIVHNYHIPYREGAELFQKCSVVVLPYIETSQSGVVLSAYGFKKPVVITDVGSVSEVVDDGITGLIVPPKNPEALARAVIKLLKNEDLRKTMGENAYRKLKTDLCWDEISAKTIQVYRKALQNL